MSNAWTTKEIETAFMRAVDAARMIGYATSGPERENHRKEVDDATAEFYNEIRKIETVIDCTSTKAVFYVRDENPQSAAIGWRRMTEEARRIQMRHLDKHEGDVYHAMQSLCVKFGLSETWGVIRD